MFISRVKLCNFGNVKNEELFFKEGITVFSGENGEGKSTVLRAIAMGLYNRFPLTLKDYVRWGQASFSMDIDFNHLGNDYEFTMSYDVGTTRNLRCVNTNEEWVNSSATEQLDSILDVKRAVASTISFEHEIDLITTQPSERREYLKGVYDLNFKRQLSIIENDISESQAKIEQLRGEIISLEAQEFELMVLDRLPFSEEKLQLYKESKSLISKELNLIEEKNKNLEQLKSSLEAKEFQLYKKRKQGDDELFSMDAMKSTKSSLDEQLENFPQDIDLSQIERNYSQLRSQSAGELEEKNKRIQFLNEEIEKKNRKRENIKSIEEEISKKESQESTLKHQMVTSKKNLELFEKGICPTCGQEIDKTDISKWVDELKDFEQNLKKTQEELEDLRSKKKQILELSKEVEELQREVYPHETTIKVLESKLDLLEEDKKKEITYERDKLNSKRQSLEKEIENLSSRIKDKLSSVVYIEDEVKSLEGEVDSLKRKVMESDLVSAETIKNKELELKEISNKINLYEETRISNQEKKSFNEKIEKSKKERDNQVKEKKKVLDDLEGDNSKFQLAKKIFSREFPAFVLSQLVRNLEKTVNEFLSRVYPQYEISIDESKNSLKITYGENKSDVKMASGFEKQIFSFAYKYALGKIQDYGILFLDEVDSAASVSNSRKFYETIGKMDACFKQLFVITHKEEIKELLSNDYQASIYQVSSGTYSLI